MHKDKVAQKLLCPFVRIKDKNIEKDFFNYKQ